jgi:hypothetical protein
MNFGEYARREVTKSGKTITWLAYEVGAHPSLIVKWRTRGSTPKAEYFLKTCQIIAKLQNRPFIDVILEGMESMGIK